jgi:hypothetical protein
MVASQEKGSYWPMIEQHNNMKQALRGLRSQLQVLLLVVIGDCSAHVCSAAAGTDDS